MPTGSGPASAVCAFTARVSDTEVQGMLREERSESGALTHVTIFVRPYHVLRAVIAKMRQLMEDSPLRVARGLRRCLLQRPDRQAARTCRNQDRRACGRRLCADRHRHGAVTSLAPLLSWAHDWDREISVDRRTPHA
jgi:hypothetical protein